MAKKKAARKNNSKGKGGKKAGSGAESHPDPENQTLLDRLSVAQSALDNANITLGEVIDPLTQSKLFLDNVVYDDKKTDFADDAEKASYGTDFAIASELIFAGRKDTSKSVEDNAAWKCLLDNYLVGVESTNGRGKNKITTRLFKSEVSAEDEKTLDKYAIVAHLAVNARKDEQSFKYLNINYLENIAEEGKPAKYRKSSVGKKDEEELDRYATVTVALCDARKAPKAAKKKAKKAKKKAAKTSAPSKEAETEKPYEQPKPEGYDIWEKIRYHPLDALKGGKYDVADLIVKDNLAEDANAAKAIITEIETNPLQAMVYAAAGTKHLQNALSKYARGGKKADTFASQKLAEYIVMMEPLVGGRSLCSEVMALAKYKAPEAGAAE